MSHSELMSSGRYLAQYLHVIFSLRTYLHPLQMEFSNLMMRIIGCWLFWKIGTKYVEAFSEMKLNDKSPLYFPPATRNGY